MSYVSQLPSGILVLDDDTAATTTVNGQEMGRGYEQRDWEADPFGSFAAPFGLPLIDPSEYADRIEEMERTKTRLSDLIKAAGMKTKNQQSTSFCWIFAATSAVQAIRIVQGEPHVELSPASVGCLVTGFRNQGGWSTQGIKRGASDGWVPSSLWPDTAISRQYDTQATKDAREGNKVQEWWELRPRNDQELMTCLLSRIPVAIGQSYWSHAVLALDPLIFSDGSTGHLDLNSWGSSYGDQGFFVQKGSKRFADDAVAPRVAA